MAGLARFTRYVLGSGPGFDASLFSSRLGETGSVVPNRMAPNTAVCFVLVGVALLVLHRRTRQGIRPSALLGLATLLLASLALLGYAYDARFLYGLPHYIPMAFNTALAFAALGLGILVSESAAASDSLVWRSGPSGARVRRRLAAAVLVPAVLGWLVLEGERLGLYDGAFSVSLVVVSTVTLLTLMLWWDSCWLSRTEAARERSEALLRHSEEKFRALAESSQDAIVSADAQGRITYWNPAAAQIFGRSMEEVLHRPLTLLMPERFRTSSREGPDMEQSYRLGANSYIVKPVEFDAFVRVVSGSACTGFSSTSRRGADPPWLRN